jgi:hypothetical protein
MPAGSDPQAVGRFDEIHLRRFAEARERRDAGEMRRWWDELVLDFKDRMDGLVAAAHRGRLDDDEHELAVQLAMIRFAQGLVDTFDGMCMGQLVNATKTLARYACIDVQREAVARRERTGPSFDDGWDVAGEAGAGRAAWQHDVAVRDFERGEAARDVRAFLAWALPQVKEERRRVLELSFAGAELAEICEELGISRDNAYQRRSRGLADLRKLKELYDG